jgi:hypothetical protein
MFRLAALFFQNRTGTAVLSGRTMAGSARFETCLTVVIVPNIRAAQNAPISAENIKRGSTTHSNPPSKTQLRRPPNQESIHYLSSGAMIVRVDYSQRLASRLINGGHSAILD